MTVRVDDIEALVAGAWPRARLVGEPEPLTGGFWATLYRLRVDGQPDGVPAELVLRIAPHLEMGAKETAIQRVLADLQFPTPAVRAACDDYPATDGWWSLTDCAPGSPLLADLDGAAALRRAPSLLRRLPRQLGSTMAVLHQIDPAPVTAAVRAVAPDVAWSVTDVLEHLRRGASASARHDIARAVDRLARDQPVERSAVICHGDLHPFNVLAFGEQLTVLDWTAALCAPPAYDAALTAFLLARPPISLPAPGAAALRPLAALLAHRFLAAYRGANPGVSLSGLEWYRALHSARVVVELTQLRAQHGPDAGGHPWRLVAPAAARYLSAHTGVAVQP